MNYNKPFLPIRDQIKRLQTRGMQIPDEAKAAKHLQHINYVRLRAYWYLFESNHRTHQFRPNTTFDDILNIYFFDRALRFHLLAALEAIEVSLRTQFAYQFSKQFGPFAYAAVTYSKNPHLFKKNLRQLHDELSRSKDVFIRHYDNKYSNPTMPPIWMACEVMSFGLLSRWYKNLKPGKVRKSIAYTYRVHNNSLDGILHHFTQLRNVIAHHGRLWDRIIIIKLPLPQNKPRNLRASMNVHKQDRLYNSLVMLLHFMDVIQPGHEWRQELIDLLTAHQVNTRAMGFPANWQTLPIWEVN